jgi:hypothetical protein
MAADRKTTLHTVSINDAAFQEPVANQLLEGANDSPVILANLICTKTFNSHTH